MKLNRLLAITMLLLNRKRVSAKDLAEYFEVSIRTIYRDIESINLAGIPIVAYQGTGGGFEIVERFKVDRHLLTPDEILSIITALKGVNTALEDRKITDTLEKIKALYPLEKDDDSQDKIIVNFNPWGGKIFDKPKLSLIKKALDKERLIGFRYTNKKGENSKRTVEPLSLVWQGTAWYLYGFCRNKQDYRFFRLSRIKDLELSAEFFSRSERKKSNPGREDRWEQNPFIDLTLRFSSRVKVRVEDNFSEEEILAYESDGSILVQTSYPEDDWVYGFILSYGEDVEVLAPQRLRELIKRKAELIKEKY